MAKNVFGLDIGTSIIKVVEVQRQRNTLTLTHAAMTVAPEKGITSESELDQAKLSQTLKKLVEDAKIDTKLVNIAFAEQLVYTRVIDVPSLSDKELTSGIHWEAEQYIPSLLSEVALDYQVLLRPTDPNSTMKVLLVAAPTILINKYKKILEDADLEPFVFETETLSTTRVIGRETQDATTLIVNIGAASTTLAILHKGVLIFTFSLPTGGNAMTKAIAAELGIDVRTSEEYKKTYGLTEELQGKVATVLLPIVKSMFGEMEKSMKFYQEKFPQGRIDRVVFSGGGAKLPGLPALVAERFGIEVEIVNPWEGIVVDERIFQEALSNAPIFTTATGLALRDYE